MTTSTVTLSSQTTPQTLSYPTSITTGATQLNRTQSCAASAWPVNMPISSSASSLLAKNVTPNSMLHFKPVMGKGREERLALVRNFFNTVLDRIYGSQASALEKIERSDSDRVCRLMYHDEKPVGLLVAKRALTNEHFSNSLEIKTLAVLPTAESGKGYGSALLQKAEQMASDLHANSIHVTVNSTVPDSLAFFKKKGFAVAAPLTGVGKEGTQELLLVKRLSDQAQKTAQVAEKTLNVQGTKRKSPEKEAAPAPVSKASTASTLPARAYYTAQRTLPNPGRQLEVTLKKPYIRMIQNGSKTVEGRINSGMFRNLNVGQRIRFFCSQTDQVTCEITGLKRYDSFEKMLKVEGFKACLPEANTLDDAVRTYHNIPSFTERAARSGVLAIQIKKI